MVPHDNPIQGSATVIGTEHYAERFTELHPDHFRLSHGLTFSSLGIGTYLGNANDETDTRYTDAVCHAILSGCNVVDTAINYRFQRSERAIGTALRRLMQTGFSREEFVLCSKGGFIPFDGVFPADPRVWVQEHLIGRGIISGDDIYGGGHCMTPLYLHHQLTQSLANLGVQTLDVYYIHNPETQLAELNESEFYQKLEAAFAALEAEVVDGRIASYGVATWDGFTATPESGELLYLEKITDAARRAGGESHHFRYIQLPVNLAMTSALSVSNQLVNSRPMTILEAASSLNISVIASASLMQGQLARSLPVTIQQAISEFPTDAAKSLQFTRSAPGITTALVGMSSREHVRENTELAAAPPMSGEQFSVLFGER